MERMDGKKSCCALDMRVKSKESLSLGRRNQLAESKIVGFGTPETHKKRYAILQTSQTKETMDFFSDEDDGQDGEDDSIGPGIVIIDEVHQHPNEINGGVDGNNESDVDDEPVDEPVDEDTVRDDRSLISFASQEVTLGVYALDICYAAWDGNPCHCSSIRGDCLLGAQCFHRLTKKQRIAKCELRIAKRVNLKLLTLPDLSNVLVNRK